MLKKTLRTVAVAVFWLGLWELLSLIIARELLLPSPVAVLARLGRLIASAQFWHITAVSLGRILLGLAASVVLGLALAVATSRSKLLRALFTPLLTVIKSTPVASFIILLIIWVGRDILPSIIVILMALPVIWSNVSAGIAGLDPQLPELAKVYRLGFGRRLRRIYIPSVLPHFLSAFRSCLGLAWKAGVAAEVLAVSSVSIGKMLYESKLYWETLDLFAWTLVVIICSLVIEKVLMSAVGRLCRKVGGEI